MEVMTDFTGSLIFSRLKLLTGKTKYATKSQHTKSPSSQLCAHEKNYARYGAVRYCKKMWKISQFLRMFSASGDFVPLTPYHRPPIIHLCSAFTMDGPLLVPITKTRKVATLMWAPIWNYWTHGLGKYYVGPVGPVGGRCRPIISAGNVGW